MVASLTGSRFAGRPKRALAKLQADVRSLHALCNVYTAPAIAQSLLDLAGWIATEDLLAEMLLEPAVGDGAILLPAVRRLLLSIAAHNHRVTDPRLLDSIRSYEIDVQAAATTRHAVFMELSHVGLPRPIARKLANSWVRTGDFLIAPVPPRYSIVVANPPYVRWSKLPKAIATRYENCGHQPANLSILFAKRCCAALRKGGKLTLLSSDRWLTSIHGKSARALAMSQLQPVGHIVTNSKTAFARTVGAYPAISLFYKQQHDGGVDIATTQAFSLRQVKVAVRAMRTQSKSNSSCGLKSKLVNEGALFGPASSQRIYRSLRNRYSTLKEVGCDIRVGVALGVKEAFIVRAEAIDVESATLVPFADTDDVLTGGHIRRTHYLACTYDSLNGVVELERYPLLRKRLKRFEARLRARSCAKNCVHWHRTIDRVDRSFVEKPKLLIVGVGRIARIGIDIGGLQPSNGLYAVTSEDWPLRALRSYLLSGVLEITAACLGQRYGGGSYRYTKHVLRHVPIPRWVSIQPGVREILINGQENSEDYHHALQSIVGKLPVLR